MTCTPDCPQTFHTHQGECFTWAKNDQRETVAVFNDATEAKLWERLRLFHEIEEARLRREQPLTAFLVDAANDCVEADYLNERDRKQVESERGSDRLAEEAG